MRSCEKCGNVNVHMKFDGAYWCPKCGYGSALHGTQVPTDESTSRSRDRDGDDQWIWTAILMVVVFIFAMGIAGYIAWRW